MIKKILIFLLLLTAFMGRSQKNSVEVFKGFIADTLTTAEINALPDIVKTKGAYFHNKDLGSLVTWDGSAWVVATGFSGDFSDLTNVPAGLADGDDDTQLSEAQVETAYNNRVAIVSQGIAETGTSTDVYRWTPQRINQAIQALTGPGGGTYTAGNGLNLNTNEFSVDTSRVIMVDISSPILGQATMAFGTNAELDGLGTPPLGTTRYEWATDGDVAVGGFSGDFNDLTNVPVNLDTDSTDDFDGSFGSLTGIPSGLADGDDDTIADGSETVVTAGTNVTVTGNGTSGTPYVINSTASGGVSDHGGLTGLGDDDHPQYLKATGTDDIEGTLRLTTGEISFNGVPGSNLSMGSDPEINIPVSGAFKFNYNGTQIGQFNANGLQMLNGFQLIPVSETYNISGWDSDVGAPNKNNLRDYFALFDSDGDGAVNNLEDGTVTEAKIATTFYDEGTNTSGLSLFGSVSGTYTISSQSYDWAKVGKQVNFTLEMTGVSGSSPVGVLRIDLSGTDFPPIVGDHVFAVHMISAGAYYPDLRITNTNTVTLSFSKLESGDFTPSGVSDADLSSTSIYITGSYITN